MRPDMHELVHQRHAAEDHPVADGHMAGELNAVGEDGLAADLAVVRDVRIGHDPVLVCQPRDADVLRGAAADGDVLADGVVVADLDRSRLVGVLLVLRRRAERGEVEDLVALADPHRPVEHDVRADPGALAHLHFRADHRVRADGHVAAELRARVDDRGRVDHFLAGWMVHRIDASATTSPPTRAVQLNLPMPRMARSKTTSSSSWSPGTTGFLKRAS